MFNIASLPLYLCEILFIGYICNDKIHMNKYAIYKSD